MSFAGLFAALLFFQAPELMIPEGTILPVVLNETLNTAKLQDNDPILFSLAQDIRTAGHRGPVLLPRGSNVVARVVTSERAGRLFGRSHLDIRVQEIITPSGVVYDGVSTKIVDFAKKKDLKGEVKADGEIQGPVHRKRDTFFLLFPPTTLFQLIATPKRGPDVVLPVETRLYVKLMSPIYVETAPRISAVTQAAPAPNPVPAPVPVPVPIPVLPTSAPFSIPTPFPQVAPLAPAVLSANALELLVAPVALYPDAILRDLFRASTRPFELAQANQWVHQARDAAGSLPAGGYNEGWDSSVKALTAYPELLQRLTADADWMMRLGASYTAQPIDVLSTVQRLRMQAKSLGRPTGSTVLISGR
jgi:hypothetical protein